MTFEHASACLAGHVFEDAGPVGCTCGADQRREGWNAAVEACAAEVESGEFLSNYPRPVLLGLSDENKRELADMLRRKKVMG